MVTVRKTTALILLIISTVFFVLDLAAIFMGHGRESWMLGYFGWMFAYLSLRTEVGWGSKE